MLILGLALALAAQATAAPEGNQQIHGSVKLPNLEGVKDDPGQRLKIASFRWAATGGGGASTTGAPPPQGSVIIKTEWPWTACQVGATYPSLSLTGGGGAGYLVENLKVSKCGTVEGAPVDSAVFDYEKVTVGTWDAAKRTVVTAEPKPH